MFHVTRCPNCRTAFRVTEAHLSAYDGKVRCGRCAFVFDAREHSVGEPAAEQTKPSAPAPQPAAPAFSQAATPAAETAYGLDTISMQLGVAAELERDEADGYASQHLQRLAQALRGDSSPTPEAPAASSNMLELELDVAGAEGIDEAADALDELPPATGAANAVPATEPLPPADVEEFSPGTDEGKSHLSPAAFEAWLEQRMQQAAADQPTTPISVVMPEISEAVLDFSQPFEPSPASTSTPTPLPTPTAEPIAPVAPVAPAIAATEMEAESPPAAASNEPAPFVVVSPHESPGYRPILTAEDEALLRVPAAPSPWRWLWSIPAMLAALGLAGQLTHHFHDELAIQVPGIKPRLARFCQYTGCTLELPARGEWLHTDWSELKFAPEKPSLIQVYATLRNQATFDQALPLLELTLSDDANRIVAKKVFAARDYLAPLADSTPAPLPTSLGPNGELRVFLQIDLGSLRASGYSLNWVYPRRI